MVGHTFLYSEPVRRLRAADQSTASSATSSTSTAQRVNLGVIREDLNALWNFGPHDISILLYLLDAHPRACQRARSSRVLQPRVSRTSPSSSLEFPERRRRRTCTTPGSTRARSAQFTVVGTRRWPSTTTPSREPAPHLRQGRHAADADGSRRSQRAPTKASASSSSGCAPATCCFRTSRPASRCASRSSTSLDCVADRRSSRSPTASTAPRSSPCSRRRTARARGRRGRERRPRRGARVSVTTDSRFSTCTPSTPSIGDELDGGDRRRDRARPLHRRPRGGAVRAALRRVLRGCATASASSNGTTALTLGLRAAGIGPGDEVVTTPITFIATVESIVEAAPRRSSPTSTRTPRCSTPTRSRPPITAAHGRDRRRPPLRPDRRPDGVPRARRPARRCCSSRTPRRRTAPRWRACAPDRVGDARRRSRSSRARTSARSATPAA